MNTIETLTKKLKEKQERIAKERDGLRKFASEIEAIADSLDQAEEDIQDALAALSCAVDTLSQYQ